MNTSAPAEINPATAALISQQTALAQQVVLRDGFKQPLDTVAGFDVAIADQGTTVYAAAVLLDANTLEPLDQQVAQCSIALLDDPSLQSFGVLPALMDALARLNCTPDFAFINGHGIDHPRRLGVAAHFGVTRQLPSIGVADAIGTGEARIALHEMRGAFTPLRDGKQQIGWLLRSKPGCPPLVISPGHNMALASAVQLTMRFVTTHHLPEPIRLAKQLLAQTLLAAT